MLDNVPVVNELGELLDVGRVKKVAVDEHCPSMEAGEVRGEEASEGEVGALGGASLPPVDAIGAQLRLLDGVDLDGDGGPLEDGVAAHSVGDVFAVVVADEDLEGEVCWVGALVGIHVGGSMGEVLVSDTRAWSGIVASYCGRHFLVLIAMEWDGRDQLGGRGFIELSY